MRRRKDRSIFQWPACRRWLIEYSELSSFVSIFQLFSQRMFMRLGFLLFLSIVANESFAQKFKSKIYFAAIYDNLQIHQIPSYIEIPALDFRIYNQGIYNTATPQLSFEFGYGIEKNWKGSKKLYSGLTLSYRRMTLSYVDNNLYYLRILDGQVTEVYFEAEVIRNLAMIQLPIGITLPVSKRVNFDFAARNNFVLKVFSEEHVDDKTFDYKVYSLEQRSPNKYMLEVSAGFKYMWPSCAVGLKYIQGLTPVYPDMENAYNQMIPSKLYFSSIVLSLDIHLGKTTQPE